MAATIRILVETSGGLDKVKRDVSDLGDTAKRSGGGFNALQEIATGAFRHIGVLALEAGAKVGKFVVDSIGVAGNFEAAVNGMAAVTGSALADAGFSFDDVKAKALQLGMDTQFSAQQAIEAMTELAKGGVPVVDVMGEATDATLALAAAAGLELGPAAEIVAKQLGVWAEEGVTAQQVADTLASAANASTVDVEGMALALANAGGTAKTAGMTFQDLNQSLALIAPNFASASDAGTSFKTFVSRLIPTTKPATEAMIALGLATEEGKSKFFDAQGAFIGMEQAAALLQTATANLSEEEKLLAFNTIFGSDAIRAAAAIANAGAPGFIAMGQAMNEAGGAAAAAEIKNRGFNFALEQMKGSLETLQIVIGSALLPVLSDLLNNYITPGINSVMQFAMAFSSMPDPVGAAAGAFIGAIPPIQGFQAIFATLQTYIPAVMAVLQSVISAVLTQINIFWGTHGAQIMAFITQTWATIMNIYNVSLQLILSIVIGVLQTLAEYIRAHGDDIQVILSGAWQFISGVITAALALIQGVLTAALAIMQGDWQAAWAAIQSMSVTFVTSIGSAIMGFLNMIAGFFGTSLAGIRDLWAHNWEQIKLYVTNINWSDVGAAVINGIISGISGASGKLADAARRAAMDAFNAAKSALGISSPSKVFMEKVGKPMAEGMALGLTNNAPMVATAGATAAQAAVIGAGATTRTTTYNTSRTINYSPTYNSAPSGGADIGVLNALSGV